jgi:carbon monoxide dehydrogenase subunit G
MKLEHRFTVPASIDETWAAFNDLERVVPCFPGATLTSSDGDGFEGACKVKLGPISLQYTGSGRFTERSEAEHRLMVDAKGKDRRGNGTAAVTVTARLTASGSTATDVVVDTDLSVTGKPAQFGRGLMQDVSDKLLVQFVDCLTTRLAEGAGPPEEHEAAEPTASATAGTGPAPAGAGSSDTGSGARAGGPAAEVDLGATVLPVLAKRMAPYLIGAVLVLLRRLFRR